MKRATIARAGRVLVLALFACDSEGSLPAGGSSAAAGVTTAATEPQELDDAQIAHVIVTANEAAVRQARAAMPRLTEPPVVAYAEAMIAEHGQSTDGIDGILAELDVDAADNPVSQELRAESADAVDTLEAAPQRLAGRLFLESQIRVHTRVIESLDAQLLAEADAPKLIAFLEEVRVTESQHLERAQELLHAMPAT